MSAFVDTKFPAKIQGVFPVSVTKSGGVISVGLSGATGGETSVATRHYATKAILENSDVPLTETSVNVMGYYAAGDLGGALYKRSASIPTHAGRIQSNDGAWWEIAETVLAPQMFGARADGVTDDATAIADWLFACATLGRKGYAPYGVYMITRIDRSIADDLDIECHAECVFKGTKSYQTFQGGTGTTTFTVTDFPLDLFNASNGIAVEVIDNATNASIQFLTAGVHYTRATNSNVLNLGAGSSPYGAVASGRRLNVTSSAPIIVLRKGTAANRINWHGGIFDASLRGNAIALAAGSGLQLSGWTQGCVEKTQFLGAANYDAAQNDRISDSGLVLSQIENFTIRDCYFRGWGDMGLYATGGSLQNNQSDDGGEISIVDCVFKLCNGGAKVIREMQRTTFIGCKFVDCGNAGILNGSTGTVQLEEAGSDYIIIGCIFKRIGRRALDLRSMARGVTVIGCRFEDIGYMLNGATPFTLLGGSVEPFPAFIFLSGCAHSSISDNRFGVRDWPATNNQRAIWITSNVFANGTDIAYSDDVIFARNTIIGLPGGIMETGVGANIRNCRYEDNIIDGVTTPIAIVSSTSVYTYVDGSGVKFQGLGTGTATRVIQNGFAPGSSVTPVSNGDVSFELTNNTTLTFKARGSDGTVRSATVTLS